MIDDDDHQQVSTPFFFHANSILLAMRCRSWQLRRVALLLGLTPISTTVGALPLEGSNGLNWGRPHIQL